MKESTCPVCSEKPDKTGFKTINGTTYKVYTHGKKSCKIVQPRMEFSKPIFFMCFVDDRETDADIHNIIAQYVKIVVVKRLDRGDIYFPEIDLLIERKDIKDLFNSIADNRIFEQPKEMMDHHAHCCIEVSGSLNEYASTRADPGTKKFETIIKQGEGVTASVTANARRFSNNRIEHFGFHENNIQLCYWAAKYAASLKKCEEKMKEPVDPDKKYVKLTNMSDSGTFFINAIRWIPGYDVERAIILFKEFGSLDNLSKNRKHVLDLKGFGDVLYQNLDDALSGKLDGEII